MNFHQICLDITFGGGLLDLTHIFILTGGLSSLYMGDAICKATGGLLLKIRYLLHLFMDFYRNCMDVSLGQAKLIMWLTEDCRRIFPRFWVEGVL